MIRRVPDLFEMAGYKKRWMRRGRSKMARYLIINGRKFRGWDR